MGKQTIRRGPGRPRVTAHELTQRKSEGEQLQKALNALELNPTSAAEHTRKVDIRHGDRTGVAQGTISAIISGKRSLSRRDLYLLARIGISADYLLGVSDSVRIGQAQTDASLETAVEQRIAADIARMASGKPWAEQLADFYVDGKAVLDSIAEREVAALDAAWERAKLNAESAENAAHSALHSLEIYGARLGKKLRQTVLPAWLKSEVTIAFRRETEDNSPTLRPAQGVEQHAKRGVNIFNRSGRIPAVFRALSINGRRL